MLHEKEILFKFKGTRDYVQGADIFDKILEFINDFFGTYPTLINGNFYKVLQHNGLYSLYEATESCKQEDCYALFSIYLDRDKYQVKVTESKSRIRSSEEYDEDQILDGVIITENKINMLVKPSFSYMEQIVAMTKKLHFIVYPNAYGKWLFTKISLKEIVNPILFHDDILVIEAKKNFHNKLTQNAIYLHDRYLGDIWYSLKT